MLNGVPGTAPGTKQVSSGVELVAKFSCQSSPRFTQVVITKQRAGPGIPFPLAAPPRPSSCTA